MKKGKIIETVLLIAVIVSNIIIFKYVAFDAPKEKKRWAENVDQITEQSFRTGFMVGAHHRGKHRIENFKFEAILDSIIDSIRTSKTQSVVLKKAGH